ncbi:MAG: hypothetical protein M1822_006902 [Bathelium mastoideum]|nr:MAG: hypothetical protein M1822_006902 [Bathelium mastoideum]
MPPRKSHEGEEGAAAKDGLSVEDLLLPRTMCQRLAKGVLPANTQIQKDALLAMSKSATVFINYIGMQCVLRITPVSLIWLMQTCSAQDAAQAADKSTIRPKDVLEAVKELEFDDFIPRLEIELEKYNTEQCNKRNSYRRQKREEKAAADVKAATQAAMSASEASRTAAGAPTGIDDSTNGDHLEEDISGLSTSRVSFGDAAADESARPPSKKMRMDGANGMAVPAVSALEDEGVEDEGEEDADDAAEEEEEEEQGDEAEERFDGEGDSEELREDPLEEAEGGEEEDDVLDGDESD